MRRSVWLYAGLCFGVVVILNGLLVYLYVSFGNCCTVSAISSDDRGNGAGSWIYGCGNCFFNKDISKSHRHQTQSNVDNVTSKLSYKSKLQNTQKADPTRKIKYWTRIFHTLRNPISLSAFQIIVVDTNVKTPIYSTKTFQEYSRNIGNKQWDLKLKSLKLQNELVLGEITWTSKYSSTGLYLVTWETFGGGVKGHLFTESSSAILSLWHDTVYHIQVEYFTSQPRKGTHKSEILTVDTSINDYYNIKKNIKNVAKDEGHNERNTIHKEFTLDYIMLVLIVLSVIILVGLMWKIYMLSRSPSKYNKLLNIPLSQNVVKDNITECKLSPPLDRA